MKIRKENPIIKAYDLELNNASYWGNLSEEPRTDTENIEGFNNSIEKFTRIRLRCWKKAQEEFYKGNIKTALKLKKLCIRATGEINYAKSRIDKINNKVTYISNINEVIELSEENVTINKTISRPKIKCLVKKRMIYPVKK